MISNEINNETDVKLTSEQIESWRRVLCSMIGSFALEATEEQIQAFRDKLQENKDEDISALRQ